MPKEPLLQIFALDEVLSFELDVQRVNTAVETIPYIGHVSIELQEEALKSLKNKIDQLYARIDRCRIPESEKAIQRATLKKALDEAVRLFSHVQPGGELTNTLLTRRT